MRTAPICFLAAACALTAASSIALGSGLSVLGKWKGTYKATSTQQKKMADGGEATLYKYARILPYIKLTLDLRSGGSYSQTLDYGSDHESTTGTWSIKGDQLTLKGVKNSGAYLSAEGTTRVFTVAKDGKSFSGKYPALHGISVKATYVR